MDAGETAGYHRGGSQHSGRHGGVLPAAALTVVVVADGDPPQSLGLVLPGYLGNGLDLLT